jgi:MFS family permease
LNPSRAVISKPEADMKSQAKQKWRGFYRGWTVVAAAAVGLSLGYIPIIGFTFSVLFKAVSSEFPHWDRSEISLAFSLSLLALGLALPVTGRLVDRFGARMVIVPGAILFALGLMSFTFLSGHLWQFYLTFAFLGIVGAATITMPYYKVICVWFTRRRALALGIATVGSGVGSTFMPSLTYAWIASFGWRKAYFLIGALVVAITIPVVGLLLKETPSDMELAREYDGDAHPQEFVAAKSGMPHRAIWRSGSFWLASVSFFLMSLTLNGCLIHLVPLLTDRGLSSKAAVFATSIFGAATLLGNLGAGYLLDRMAASLFSLVVFSLGGLGIFLLWQGRASPLPFIAVFLMGVGMGAQSVVMPYIVSRYFGVHFFGEIYGYMLTVYTLGAIAGPMIMGAVFDSTRSYSLALGPFFIAALVSAGLMKWLGPYHPEPAAAKSALD